MSGKMSNKDRIARAAEEAAAARKEKAAKSDAPGASRGAKARNKHRPARIKITWVVCDQTGKQVQAYPYAEEEAARADAQQRTVATGKSHFVTRAEVPFE
jgi:hypothetical protein